MIQLKYADETQIKHQSEIKEGDIIAYFCDYQKREVHAEVLGLLEPVVENVIICRRLDEELADLVDFHKVPVYLVNSLSLKPKIISQCECGAAFTSNPKFHLSFCPLK